MSTGRDEVAGDWFVIDYTAIKASTCSADFVTTSRDCNVDLEYCDPFNPPPAADSGSAPESLPEPALNGLFDFAICGVRKRDERT